LLCGVSALSLDTAARSWPRLAIQKWNAVAHALPQSGSVMRIRTNLGNRVLNFSLGLHNASK
jgi:hypothetical protein